jgi:hypothetical protein
MLGKFAMCGLVGVAVQIDRGLEVGVAELLLHEEDRATRCEPPSGARLAQVMHPVSTTA